MQLSFVRCVAIIIVDCHVLSVHERVRAHVHTEVGGGTRSIVANNKAQGKQCKAKQCVFKGCVCMC